MDNRIVYVLIDEIKVKVGLFSTEGMEILLALCESWLSQLWARWIGEATEWQQPHWHSL